MARGKRAPIVYCRECKGSAHVNDRDPGCLCNVGWETKDGKPCYLDGTPCTCGTPSARHDTACFAAWAESHPTHPAVRGY